MARVTIVGTGFLGGSLGLALKGRHQRTGFDINADEAEAARAGEALDRVAASVAEAVAGADLVVLATPVAASIELLGTLHPGPGTVVTDLGSTKSAVVEVGLTAAGPRFVGGHPMAGSERHGFAAAHADLFQGAWWILTPVEQTSAAAYRAVATLTGEVGARPVALAPETHDGLVARISHLPQLVAAAVVAVAAVEDRSMLGLAAGGFRDVTRIAASPTPMWLDIIRSNHEAIVEALEALTGELDTTIALVKAQQWERLGERMEAARHARRTLFIKDVEGGDPVPLTLLIPDRPGVLAEVTTAAGELGVNIEDIEIFHSPEGGRGRLEIVVAGRGAAETLTTRLSALGYHVDLGLPG